MGRHSVCVQLWVLSLVLNAGFPAWAYDTEAGEDTSLGQAGSVPGTEWNSGSASVHESPQEALKQIKARGMHVVTFAGNSGTRYQVPKQMEAQVDLILKKYACDMEPDGVTERKVQTKPYHCHNTVINVGATEVGIGVVYQMAQKYKLQTMGIVSSNANRPKNEYLNFGYSIQDEAWGGLNKGGPKLSLTPQSKADAEKEIIAKLTPTSQAMTLASDEMYVLGGGDVSAAEMQAVRNLGRPVHFYAFESNYDKTFEKAQKSAAERRRNGDIVPEVTRANVDYQGAAYRADQEYKAAQ